MRHKKQNGPPHPGQVLDQYLDGLSISEVARALGVSRSTLSRILSCASRVFADVAIRLGLALGTSPDLWEGLQLRYDLYQAGLQKRSGIKRLVGPAKDKSVLELKGMFTVPDGVRVPIEEMRVKLPADSRAWDEMPPVGREIGSPDHDRLEALDGRSTSRCSLSMSLIAAIFAGRRFCPCSRAALYANPSQPFDSSFTHGLRQEALAFS